MLRRERRHIGGRTIVGMDVHCAGAILAECITEMDTGRIVGRYAIRSVIEVVVIDHVEGEGFTRSHIDRYIQRDVAKHALRLFDKTAVGDIPTLAARRSSRTATTTIINSSIG